MSCAGHRTWMSSGIVGRCSVYNDIHKKVLLYRVISSFIPRSFPPPVFDHLQQIPRWKAWEIWSCALTSGRQMVDTQGAVPVEES